MNSAISSDSSAAGEVSGSPRLYKVSFDIPADTERWAPGTNERLWTEKSGTRMEVYVRNTPFYVRGIAFGDLILVRPDNEARELVFDRVVEKSGNSTVRAIVKDAIGRTSLTAVLNELECSWETDSSGLLWAIDVPASKNYGQLHERLADLAGSGAIEVEEAAISEKHEGDLAEIW
ncbi:DUF4265 domain-containing protein [Kribbella ginsengisoli]|uniref:DUF4265 domain-containing protein n=1 Tax=Kribbella ginsengisoli TaxID=363865 RepID=A0ABP6XBH5_9ACTN